MKKVLIASNEPDLNGKIEKRFGHSRYFILINPDSMDFKAIPNAIEASNPDTIGDILAMGIDAVITGNIGPGAFEILHQNGIPVYIVRNKTVEEAVEALKAGTLNPADQPTMKNSPHDGRGIGMRHDHKHDHHASGTSRGPGRGTGMGRGRGMGGGRGRNR